MSINKKKTPCSEQIKVWLPEVDQEELYSLCNGLGISVSCRVRLLIKEDLQRWHLEQDRLASDHSALRLTAEGA